MKTEKNEISKNWNYVYVIVSFFVAFMYLCKPIASAQNPPVIKKKKEMGSPKSTV